jgi:hypothetical protein
MFMAIERILVLGLALLGPPIEDWNDADDLETCETVCEKKGDRRATNDISSEAEVIVIDLDQLGSGQTRIDVGHGLTVELAHGQPAGSHELVVWIADEEDLCEVPILEEMEVRPIEQREAIGPVPNEFRLGATTEETLLPVLNDDEAPLLPAPARTGRDETTAHFQRTYQTLLAEGRRAEADALAAEFLAEDDLASAVPVKSLEKRIAPTLHHQVGYRPEAAGTWVRRYPGSDAARWSDVAHRRITVRFDRTPVDELARFLRWATGLSVEVELSAQLADELRCQVECNDLPMAEAIEAIGRQLHVRIVPHEDRLVVRE